MDRNERLARLEALVKAPPEPSDDRNFFSQEFGLPGNPFTPGGIADATGDFPPLRDDQFEQVLGFIESSYQSPQTNFLVVYGDYGSGKTQLLRYVEFVV